MTESDTADGRFDPMPSAASVAQFTTPFPDFDDAGRWQVDAAVHDLNEALVARRVSR